MKFEFGKTYKHASGRTMKVVGVANTDTYGACLVGEDSSRSDLCPIGGAEWNAENWEEVREALKEPEAAEPGNLESHAERELRAAGLFDKDSDYGGMMAHSTLKLIKVFAEEGHSGFSAGMAVTLFEKLARFEPLGPLTGEDSEWNEVGVSDGDGLLQNNRCSHVFKRDGKAWDIEGKIFREQDGSCFMSSDSHVDVTFPYTPTREYIDVETPGDVQPPAQ